MSLVVTSLFDEAAKVAPNPPTWKLGRSACQNYISQAEAAIPERVREVYLFLDNVVNSDDSAAVRESLGWTVAANAEVYECVYNFGPIPGGDHVFAVTAYLVAILVTAPGVHISQTEQSMLKNIPRASIITSVYGSNDCYASDIFRWALLGAELQTRPSPTELMNC